MAIAFVADIPAMTPEQADKVIQALDLKSRPAEGQILHIDGAWEGGTRAVDVWESMEHFERFLQDRLGPAMAQAGVEGAPPTPVPFTVRNLVK